MKRLPAALTAPVVAFALLAGCSGGGSSTDSAEETGAESTPTPSEPAEESPSAGASDPAVANAPGADTEYCKLLSTDFATLFSSIQGPDDVTKAIDVIEDIVAEAPPEVADEWKTMSGALDDMEGALRKAAELQEQAASGKVSQKELQRKTQDLMKDMESLDTPQNNEAGDTVAKHAADYCGVTLG